ncbi:MAG TPA: Fe-S cluster assembly protein SufD [Candidatus Thermoplasmatota archaeon]
MGESVTANAEYVAHFRRLNNDENPAWLRSLRNAAFQRFEQLGFPTQKQEEWGYTNPAPFSQASAPAVADTAGLTRNDAKSHSYHGLDAFELVFINGHYAPSLSSLRPLASGVRVQSLASVLAKNPQDAEAHLGQVAAFDHNPFTALNTALFSDGAFIELAPGANPKVPIHLLFVGRSRGTPTVQFPRILVHAGKQSRLDLIESYVGAPDSVHITNAVTELVLDEGAQVHRHKIQREAPEAHHLQTVEAELQRDAKLVDHNVAFGAKVARTDVGVRFADQGGEVTMNGLYVLGGQQHIDNHTRVDHAQPNCQSNEFYKGILDGKSHGVFYGRVIVRKDAQKTNSTQTNKNLLLSDGALVDSIPALEINADDVKCAHGSTIGQVDKDAIFYLRSRGIDEKTARSLLTYGFARDVLSLIKIPALRDNLDELVLARLPNGRTVKEALHEVI